MLTTVEPGLAVQIDVSSVVVRLALTYVTGERGWSRCTHEAADRCGCLRIGDRPTTDGPVVDVLITQHTPAACQAALDAVLHARARSVALWDEPETIPSTIDALRAGSVVVPARVIDQALQAPRLTPRLHATVRLIALGRSNGEIAAQLHQSMSTTKRDLAELLELFDVTNRTALMTAAVHYGFL